MAQALHWFDIPGFFAEAQRVLKANGVLAVWSYDYCAVEPDVDHVLHDIFAEVEDFWPPERAIVVSRYRDIELPAAEMAVPGFTMSVRWSVEQMLGYLRTWSATQRYLQTHATDPIGVHEAALRQAWGDATLQVSWPLTVRVCRVAAQ